ncbi:MAG: gene transfer agent family protein [Hyphomonadaceae bacterium]|nr:gene transfer agent family protein [Hyphomonadaceae bacterium]
MTVLCNKARGEVVLEVDDAPLRLCLTLGALAELEAAFDVVSLSELAERLGKLSAADMLVVLAALTSGGQAKSVAELAASKIDPKAAARAVAEAFSVALEP